MVWGGNDEGVVLSDPAEEFTSDFFLVEIGVKRVGRRPASERKSSSSEIMLSAVSVLRPKNQVYQVVVSTRAGGPGQK